MSWTIEKLTGTCGARLTGCDLNTLSSTEFGDLRAALFAHGFVVLPEQSLTPDGHIALAERFGPINVNRFFTPVASHPRIAKVYTPKEAARVIGGTWHSDHSYDAAPAMCSILVARDLPPHGGDTQFASMTSAARALSDGLKDTLRGLRAIHSDASFKGSDLGMTQAAEAYQGGTSHPILIRHPDTQEEAVYVNADFTTHIEGWSAEESAPLLNYLYAFVTRPQFTARVVWQPGMVAIWDNRLVQHFATADYLGHERLMHRVTVEGVPLG